MLPATEDEALEAVRTLISYIGDDPDREGLLETPARVLAAWRESWGRGYYEDISARLTSFTDDSDYDQLVIQRGIVFSSFCEHHMALFHGEATVAYQPHGKIIGLSKLARIVEHFSSRLQVQERLTSQIAGFLEHYVSPDCAVRLEATHSCMTTRGVRQPHSLTVTTALRGLFRLDAATQQEFLTEARR